MSIPFGFHWVRCFNFYSDVQSTLVCPPRHDKFHLHQSHVLSFREPVFTLDGDHFLLKMTTLKQRIQNPWCQFEDQPSLGHLFLNRAPPRRVNLTLNVVPQSLAHLVQFDLLLPCPTVDHEVLSWVVKLLRWPTLQRIVTDSGTQSGESASHVGQGIYDSRFRLLMINLLFKLLISYILLCCMNS